MPFIYPLKLYVRHPVTVVFFGFTALVNIAVWVLLITQIPYGSDQVFLHYTVFFGVDDIGSWQELLIVPAGGLLILLMNGIFGWLLFQRDKYLAHWLNATSCVTALFLFAASFLTVILNS